MVRIKKKATLKGQLMALPIGETVVINAVRTGWIPHRVRETVSRLKKDGYLFECTERDYVNAIRVTRLQ